MDYYGDTEYERRSGGRGCRIGTLRYLPPNAHRVYSEVCAILDHPVPARHAEVSRIERVVDAFLVTPLTK